MPLSKNHDGMVLVRKIDIAVSLAMLIRQMFFVLGELLFSPKNHSGRSRGMLERKKEQKSSG